MTKDNYYIITGAPGSGKSSLLQELHRAGFKTVHEPGRRVLAEQRRIDGDGIPGKDNRVFVDLMMSKAVDDYRLCAGAEGPVFFDRGVPDNLSYAELFEFDYPSGQAASWEYRYNGTVFFCPAWKEIYCHDEERKMPFHLAVEFDNSLRRVYERCDYALIDVPCLSVEERVEFVINKLKPINADVN